MRGRPLLLVTLAVACSPYVALKLLWIAGASTGVRDVGLMRSPTYLVANIVTLFMDLTLVLVVAVLSGPRSTGPLGRRLAVLAVLGLGLLLPVVVGAPTIAVVEALRPAVGTSTDSGIEGWVFVLVYGGFTVQFGCLAVATAVHLRRRPAVLSRAAGSPLLAGLAGGLGAAHVGGLLGWAFGTRVGLTSGAELAGNTRLLYGVLAALAIATAGLAARAADDPVRRFLALVGATSVWTWALFSLLTTVATPDGPPIVNGTGVAIWLCGAVWGVAACAAHLPARVRAGRG